MPSEQSRVDPHHGSEGYATKRYVDSRIEFLRIDIAQSQSKAAFGAEYEAFRRSIRLWGIAMTITSVGAIFYVGLI